jgi:hypothetical protein
MIKAKDNKMVSGRRGLNRLLYATNTTAALKKDPDFAAQADLGQAQARSHILSTSRWELPTLSMVEHSNKPEHR